MLCTAHSREGQAKMCALLLPKGIFSASFLILNRKYDRGFQIFPITNKNKLHVLVSDFSDSLKNGVCDY